ncbi:MULTISPECIES: hypothetical protein [Agrobacterium]|uniref:hypothetical protein n=1 Tax=Agrobacterium TaxID=357 RepID=UPI0009BA4954|nr:MULTISPECIES: hypothetical protein [Agrobacterium]QCL77434.1 hypothetical protein CFBP5499_28695 [Agrobacterium tumefaciens]CUX72256.1 conserved exported hypothetical protein [Agrobacterium sp. NCPPB 925]
MKAMYFAAATVAALAMAPSVKAQDASWGCQVLLCAASSSPSWQGVAYCVPPMKKLISAMKKPGFSWPICHEAKAGKPAYEPYEDCPAGFQVSNSDDGNGGRRLGGLGGGNMCTKTVNQCRNRAEFRTLYGNTRENERTNVTVRSLGGNNDNNDSCMVQVSQPRPLRKDPYRFDIPNDQGVKQSHWFNLNL